jgi:hypothetical protein
VDILPPGPLRDSLVAGLYANDIRHVSHIAAMRGTVDYSDVFGQRWQTLIQGDYDIFSKSYTSVP